MDFVHSELLPVVIQSADGVIVSLESGHRLYRVQPKGGVLGEREGLRLIRSDKPSMIRSDQIR